MSSFFDGMTGLLTGIFGGSVSHTPPDGDPYIIDAVFREEPIEIIDQDGRDVLMLSPSLRVPGDHADGIVRGSEIAPGNGKTYRVLSAQASGSPANDAFVIFELERIDAP